MPEASTHAVVSVVVVAVPPQSVDPVYTVTDGTRPASCAHARCEGGETPRVSRGEEGFDGSR